MDKPKHAFYSAEAAEKFGTVVYAQADGTQVTATCITDDAEGSEYFWDDKVYVGEVTRFISTTIQPNLDTHRFTW